MVGSAAFDGKREAGMCWEKRRERVTALCADWRRDSVQGLGVQKSVD